MGKRIILQYSDAMPAAPAWRHIEKLALADRCSLDCRFGEPCDPRQLIRFYDVYRILETYQDYKAYYGRSLNGAFNGLKNWSGMAFQMGNGTHLIMINSDHHPRRRTLTIAHEFGHLVCCHEPIQIERNGLLHRTRYSDEQEIEAYVYGLAVLIPYAPLLQMLEQACNDN